MSKYDTEVLDFMYTTFYNCQCAWEMTPSKCVDVFNKYNVWKYIKELYELIHLQSDNRNIKEIEEYIDAQKKHKSK